jgi:hypothetical protein
VDYAVCGIDSYCPVRWVGARALGMKERAVFEVGPSKRNCGREISCTSRAANRFVHVV